MSCGRVVLSVVAGDQAGAAPPGQGGTREPRAGSHREAQAQGLSREVREIGFEGCPAGAAASIRRRGPGLEEFEPVSAIDMQLEAGAPGQDEGPIARLQRRETDPRLEDGSAVRDRELDVDAASKGAQHDAQGTPVQARREPGDRLVHGPLPSAPVPHPAVDSQPLAPDPALELGEQIDRRWPPILPSLEDEHPAPLLREGLRHTKVSFEMPLDQGKLVAVVEELLRVALAHGDEAHRTERLDDGPVLLLAEARDDAGVGGRIAGFGGEVDEGLGAGNENGLAGLDPRAEIGDRPAQIRTTIGGVEDALGDPRPQRRRPRRSMQGQREAARSEQDPRAEHEGRRRPQERRSMPRMAPGRDAERRAEGGHQHEDGRGQHVGEVPPVGAGKELGEEGQQDDRHHPGRRRHGAHEHPSQGEDEQRQKGQGVEDLGQEDEGRGSPKQPGRE